MKGGGYWGKCMCVNGVFLEERDAGLKLLHHSAGVAIAFAVNGIVTMLTIRHCAPG